MRRQMLERKLLSGYCPIELAVAENTLFALPPINRIVPTTNTKMTASITAYSAISCPSSCDQSLRRKSVMSAPPCEAFRLYTSPITPTENYWCDITTAIGPACRRKAGYGFFRKISEPAAVRGDAGPDRSAPGTDGIDNGGQVSNGIRLQRVGGRRGVARVTEYRAIAASVGSDPQPLGAVRLKIVSHCRRSGGMGV